MTALKESGIWRFSNELCKYKMLMGVLLCVHKVTLCAYKIIDNFECSALCVYKMGHFRHFFEKMGILFSYDVSYRVI